MKGNNNDETWGLQVRVSDIIVRDPAVVQAATHPLLFGILSKYLGQRVRCATFSSNTLLRQQGQGTDTGLGWHVDYPYHDTDQPWPRVDRPLGVQVLYCLDEFTACNGGTLFRTNTQHLLKRPDYKYDTPPPTQKVGELAVCCEQLGRAPTQELKEGFTPDPNITAYHPAAAGSVLLAHSAWWHWQVRNVAKTSGHHPNWRTAFLGNFSPGFVCPKMTCRRNSRRLWRPVVLSHQETELCSNKCGWGLIAVALKKTILML